VIKVQKRLMANQLPIETVCRERRELFFVEREGAVESEKSEDEVMNELPWNNEF